MMQCNTIRLFTPIFGTWLIHFHWMEKKHFSKCVSTSRGRVNDVCVFITLGLWFMHHTPCVRNNLHWRRCFNISILTSRVSETVSEGFVFLSRWPPTRRGANTHGVRVWVSGCCEMQTGSVESVLQLTVMHTLRKALNYRCGNRRFIPLIATVPLTFDLIN